MVAPLSEVPPEGSLVFSLFSLVKLHLASHPLATSYSRATVSAVFCAQNIFFGVRVWGPVKEIMSQLLCAAYVLMLKPLYPIEISTTSPMKQNLLFPFILITTPIKPVYIPLPLVGLSFTPAVTNVRYSVNYRNNRRAGTDRRVDTIVR